MNPHLVQRRDAKGGTTISETDPDPLNLVNAILALTGEGVLEAVLDPPTKDSEALLEKWLNEEKESSKALFAKFGLDKHRNGHDKLVFETSEHLIDQLRPESEAKEKHSAQERFRLFFGILLELHAGAELLKLVWERHERDRWGAKAVLKRGQSVTSLIQNNEPKLRQDIEDINGIGYAMVQSPTDSGKVIPRISHDSFNNTRLEVDLLKSGKLLKNQLLILEDQVNEHGLGDNGEVEQALNAIVNFFLVPQSQNSSTALCLHAPTVLNTEREQNDRLKLLFPRLFADTKHGNIAKKIEPVAFPWDADTIRGALNEMMDGHGLAEKLAHQPFLEVDHHGEQYFVLHGDEWTANFFINDTTLYPIDFEDCMIINFRGKKPLWRGGHGRCWKRMFSPFDEQKWEDVERVKSNPESAKEHLPLMNSISAGARLFTSIVQVAAKNDKRIFAKKKARLSDSENRRLVPKLVKKMVTSYRHKLLNLKEEDWRRMVPGEGDNDEDYIPLFISHFIMACIDWALQFRIKWNAVGDGEENGGRVQLVSDKWGPHQKSDVFDWFCEALQEQLCEVLDLPKPNVDPQDPEIHTVPGAGRLDLDPLSVKKTKKNVDAVLREFLQVQGESMVTKGFGGVRLTGEDKTSVKVMKTPDGRMVAKKRVGKDGRILSQEFQTSNGFWNLISIYNKAAQDEAQLDEKRQKEANQERERRLLHAYGDAMRNWTMSPHIGWAHVTAVRNWLDAYEEASPQQRTMSIPPDIWRAWLDDDYPQFSPNIRNPRKARRRWKRSGFRDVEVNFRLLHEAAVLNLLMRPNDRETCEHHIRSSSLAIGFLPVFDGPHWNNEGERSAIRAEGVVLALHALEKSLLTQNEYREHILVAAYLLNLHNSTEKNERMPARWMHFLQHANTEDSGDIPESWLNQILSKHHSALHPDVTTPRVPLSRAELCFEAHLLESNTEYFSSDEDAVATTKKALFESIASEERSFFIEAQLDLGQDEMLFDMVDLVAFHQVYRQIMRKHREEAHLELLSTHQEKRIFNVMKLIREKLREAIDVLEVQRGMFDK